MSELENGRLVRLLCKFGFINERPEFARDSRWSETGDRYIIKLFRDYVFHQVDEHGQPVVNLSHVLTCLNKVSTHGLAQGIYPTDRCSWMLEVTNASCLSPGTSRAVSSSATVRSNHASSPPLGTCSFSSLSSSAISPLSIEQRIIFLDSLNKSTRTAVNTHINRTKIA